VSAGVNNLRCIVPGMTVFAGHTGFCTILSRFLGSGIPLWANLDGFWRLGVGGCPVLVESVVHCNFCVEHLGKCLPVRQRVFFLR
jgi:hypothetical protein